MLKTFKRLAVLSALLLTSCGNKSCFMDPGNFTYTHAHIVTYSSEAAHVDIDTWYGGSNGIELKLVDGTVMFCSEGTYVLYDSDTCPICETN